MIIRMLLRIALLALAFAVATALVGWAGVPIAALAWGVLARQAPAAGLVAALAGAIAWGGLLLWFATRAPIGALATIAGGAVGAPGWALIVLTLVFAAAIAWAAARTSAGIAGEFAGRGEASLDSGNV